MCAIAGINEVRVAIDQSRCDPSPAQSIVRGRPASGGRPRHRRTRYVHPAPRSRPAPRRQDPAAPEESQAGVVQIRSQSWCPHGRPTIALRCAPNLSPSAEMARGDEKTCPLQQQALLPSGWQRVRSASTPRIEPSRPAPRPRPMNGSRHRRPGRAERAQPCLPARHGRARRVPARPEDDSFWTWREVMYRFLARDHPRRRLRRSRAGLRRDARSRLYRGRRVPLPARGRRHDGEDASSPSASPRPRAASGSRCCRSSTRTPASAAPRRKTGSGDSLAIPTRSRALRACTAALGDACRTGSARTACARSRRTLERSVALAPADPIHIHAAEQVREVEEMRRVVGATSGSNGCSSATPSIDAGAWCTRRT